MKRTYCDGIGRRDFLRVGAAGASARDTAKRFDRELAGHLRGSCREMDDRIVLGEQRFEH